MKIWSSDLAIGESIHRRVVAEGGWMVHIGDKSFFERRAEDGSLTRMFSPELMAEIRASVGALKVYAASRRRSMERISAPPPAIGSSEYPAKRKPKTRRSACTGVQR